DYSGKKVLIVGEGNSGAQLLAELSKITRTEWAVRSEPEFLPPDVDGRVLFNVATAKYHAEQKGEKFDASKYNLGNIVQVPPVKEALERDAIKSKGALKEITADGIVWETSKEEEFDVIIWCTGFGYATDHLQNIAATDKRGKIKTEGTRADENEGLWLVGYGGWTGYASATLIGVGRTAKETVKEVEAFLKREGKLE
ncbi:MAG: pyridine nucleotide-disulfide oxidoreductase, partial [Cryomorphaceae bacterium]